MSEVRFKKVDSSQVVLSIGPNYLVSRTGSGGTVEILDIAVTERRIGIGRRLVEALLRSIPDECPTVYAITRIENEVAQQFYEKLGFDKVAVVRRFYRDTPFPNGKAADAIIYGRSPRGPI